LVALLLTSTPAHAVALPPSTWVALNPLAATIRGPIFAIAVNPTSTGQVIAGDFGGALYRTTDSGTTWSPVFNGKAAILTAAYDPLIPGIVLAGTQGAGVVQSQDAGAKWTAATGIEGRTVHAFAFARAAMFAATDQGVYTSADGKTWVVSGLANASLDSVAAMAVNPPARIVAGGTSTSGSILMYQSVDGGTTWSHLSPQISGTIVTRLAAGPLPPNSATRPLVVGTNSGLFISQDAASTFTPLSGGELLPSIDYTQAAFTGAHFDRFYVASDGGGGGNGGLWATADSGQHFSSLKPPVPSITALAVSTDEQPVLYVATFRAIDHEAMLWAYRDTGGAPQGPFIFVSPSASAARTNSNGNWFIDLVRSIASSQVPYIALGVIALGVILLAAISHFRSRRR
jgi:hypothetical protein